MVDHVISVEGPLFEQLLVRRIARAHEFRRAGGEIEATVRKAVDPRFPRSNEGDQAIYWPEGGDPSVLAPYRHSSTGERAHGEIPIIELASLARQFLDEGADEEETLLLMAERTRVRKFERANSRSPALCS